MSEEEIEIKPPKETIEEMDIIDIRIQPWKDENKWQ